MKTAMEKKEIVQFFRSAPLTSASVRTIRPNFRRMRSSESSWKKLKKMASLFRRSTYLLSTRVSPVGRQVTAQSSSAWFLLRNRNSQHRSSDYIYGSSLDLPGTRRKAHSIKVSYGRNAVWKSKVCLSQLWRVCSDG